MDLVQILKNLGICLACAIFAGCTYASQGFPDDDRGALPIETVDIYGDIAKRIVYPEQNWDPSDSLWFYYTSQGSDLMDYNIFLHLEQADSTADQINLFRSNENMEKYRFLTQRGSDDNEARLPIGWVKDSYEGKDYIGFTCATCHTTQVNYNGIGIRIDGGPSMADMQTMFKELEQALKRSLPDEDPEKFTRLAKNVLKHDASNKERLSAFRKQLENNYTKIKALNHKDDHKDGPFYGFGRLDAFGRIFNRIESVRAPSSIGKEHPADAPVSYPFLWDTPHHDFVQWNGIAGNTGVGGLGPLGRNASEVLGVFATVHAGKREPWLITKLLGFGNYSSSLRKWNQVSLERKIKHLWSPSWEQLAQDQVLPEIKGLPKNEEKRAELIKKIQAADEKKLDELMKGLSDWELGLAAFKKYKCVSCHTPIDRQDGGRRVVSQFSSVEMIGTDKKMAENALTYCSQNEFPEVPKEEECMTPDGKKGIKGGDAITHLTGEVLANGAIWDLPLLAVSWGSNPWKSWMPFMTAEADRHVDFEVVNEKTTSKAKLLYVYKGRPLNGIWATAPYLHNGSVPNLYELFLPSDCKPDDVPGETCRSKTFTVGNRELDTKYVGFKQLDKNNFSEEVFKKLVFDTSLLGNSNEGHEYAVGVTPIIKTDKDGKAIRKSDGTFAVEYLEPIKHDERMALIEYLKSL